MSPWLWLLLYSAAVLAASLLGGALPTLVRLTHTRTQLMMSLVAGLMLGVGMFHMLPHAVVYSGSVDRTMAWAVAGLLAMFLLIRAFQFHHHADPEHAPAWATGCEDACPEHRHPPPELAAGPPHGWSWLGVALGMAVHSAIDGMAIASGLLAQSHGQPLGAPGLGIFVAVLLHKPLDALSITSVMAAAGYSRRWQRRVNVAYALICPGAAVLFFAVAFPVQDAFNAWIGAALAFSGGVFLCISLGDLLPEVHFHAHDRVKLSLALLAGVALSYAIGFLEPTHYHGHEPPAVNHPADSSSGHHNHAH